MTLLDDTIMQIKHIFPSLGISMTGVVESADEFERSVFRQNLNAALCTSLSISVADIKASWHLLYMVTMHTRSGSPTFRLSSALVDMLLATDIPKVDSTLLRLPYPCIKLDISKTPLQLYNSQVIYIYVAHIDDRFRIYYGCSDSTGVYNNLVTMLDPEVKTIHDSFCVTLQRAKAKNSMVDKSLVVFRALEQATNKKHWSEETDLFFLEYKRLLTLTINAILYITSTDADLEKENIKIVDELRQKLKKMKSGIAKDHITKIFAAEKQKSIYIVGKSLQAMSKIEPTETGTKMSFRHQVRGHWKIVPHGKRLEQRKQKWIMPYWRGPDMAEILARNYVVTAPNEKNKGI
jgi:hypothetical protein